MKLSEKEIELLGDLMKAQENNPAGENFLRFQANHEDDLREIDFLRSNGFIEQRDGVCVIKLLGLSVIATSNSMAKAYLTHCSALFMILRASFKENPEKKLLVTDLTVKAGLPLADAIRALVYLRDAPMWGGYSINLEKPDSYVVPGVSILRYKTFDSILDEMCKWADSFATQQEALKALTNGVCTELEHGPEATLQEYVYVDFDRLKELRESAGKWDMSRLCKLCEELNLSYKNDCFLAVSMLMRSILDHVPPAFGCGTFSDVANHYAGARSFKAAMQRLDASLRHIADGYLHVQLRASESLPTRNQVEFRAELDLLLGEVIRLQKKYIENTQV